MPVYGALLALSIDPSQLWGSEHVDPKRLIIVLIVYTIFAPVLSIVFMFLAIRKPLKEGLLMDSRESRTFPFLLTLIFYFAIYWSMLNGQLPSVILSMILAAAIALLLAVLINFYWKISIHMIGLGGIAGMLLGFAQSQEVYVLHALLPVVVVAGMVGTSRLYLNKHQPIQVYAGFLLGLGVEYLFVNYQLTL